MINLVNCCSKKAEVKFIGETAPELEKLSGAVMRIFKGEYLQTAFLPEEDKMNRKAGQRKNTSERAGSSCCKSVS